MNCDPLARWYRWLEYAGFGRALERRRLAFLPSLTEARKVLMLGEGDGRFLVAFLHVNPSAEVDYVDSSREMLAIATRRVQNALGRTENVPARVRFHHADALTWLQSGPPRAFDLVYTHFFLDCFTSAQLHPLVDEIGRHVTGSVRWIVSEFAYPSGGLAAWGARLFIGVLYDFFRVVTGLKIGRLPDHGAVLWSAGFRRTAHLTAARGLLISERWERA